MTEDAKHFKNYQILDHLGQGQFTNVYLVRHTKTGERRALKVFKGPYLNDPVFQKRFEREFNTVKDLSHPNLVKYFEGGELNGEPFIVMEYLGKTTLQHLLAYHGRAPVEIAVTIMEQVLQGLSYLHQNRILHRDIKPSAIFINSNGVAKLADFDIAKPISGAEGDDSVTRKGEIVGSPRYMSPEQRLAETITERSDVFAAGVTFYEMVTGQTPWQSEDYLRTDRRAWASIPPPRKLVDSMSPELDQFILTSIEFQPGRRFASAEKMLVELERFSKAPFVDLADWAKGRKLSDVKPVRSDRRASTARLVGSVLAMGLVLLLLTALLVQPILNALSPSTPTPTYTVTATASPTLTPTPQIFTFPADTIVTNFLTGEAFSIAEDSKVIVINPSYSNCEVLANWNGTQILFPAKLIYPDRNCP